MRDKKNYYRIGNVCGEKIEYDDGIGCCIWQPFDDDEGSGFAWDFDYEDINDLVRLLQLLQQVEAIKYVEHVEEE